MRARSPLGRPGMVYRAVLPCLASRASMSRSRALRSSASCWSFSVSVSGLRGFGAAALPLGPRVAKVSPSFVANLPPRPRPRPPDGSFRFRADPQRPNPPPVLEPCPSGPVLSKPGIVITSLPLSLWLQMGGISLCPGHVAVHASDFLAEHPAGYKSRLESGWFCP
jgi:hypothetical protein